MAEWTDVSAIDTGWSSQGEVYGIPYNSRFLYNSNMSYNAEGVRYSPSWGEAGRDTRDWTTTANQANTWATPTQHSVDWTD